MTVTPRLDQLHRTYEDLQPGNRYALSYHSNLGTYLELNGSPRLSIEGRILRAPYSKFGFAVNRFIKS